MDFGRKASNLLLKGSTTSASAMALGGAAVGGAYDGLVGDGDFVGGAMRGAVAGAGAKFASNMYGMGTARAIGAAANKGTSISDGLQLSRFTSGFEQAGRRGYMHSGFSQRPGVTGLSPSETSAQGSMRAADRPVTPEPIAASAEASVSTFDSKRKVGKNLNEEFANQRRPSQDSSKVGRELAASERAGNRDNARRRDNGSHVSFEAQQRLANSRVGGTSVSSSSVGSTDRSSLYQKGNQIDMFGGEGARTNNTAIPKKVRTTGNPRQQELLPRAAGIAEDFSAYNRAESSMGLF